MAVPGAPGCVHGVLKFAARRMTRPQAANLRMMVVALLIGVTERLADFREASKRHRILKLLQRSNVPTRFKNRLQELLMAG